MGVGVQLKKVLQERNITIKQLAEDTGIPLNTLYSITKRDSMNVRPETVQGLATVLGVSPTYLIGYDEKIVNPERYTPEELAEMKAGAWDAYQQYVEETTGPRGRITRALTKLSQEGQEKAVERVEELLEIPRYQRSQTPTDGD